MNITEDYCSFEVAKLLKEKGFDESTSMVYMSYGDLCKLSRYDSIRNSNYNDITKNYFEYTAPTHQMAIAWLRETHGIFILIKPCDSYFDEEYEFSIYKKQNTVIFEWELLEIENSLYKGYEETVEAALKYVLENLI